MSGNPQDEPTMFYDKSSGTYRLGVSDPRRTDGGLLTVEVAIKEAARLLTELLRKAQNG